MRLFVAVDWVPRSDTRIHAYVGEFRLDGANRNLERIAPGEDGTPRRVFVFRLLPVGVVDSDLGETSSLEGADKVAQLDTVAVDEVPVAVVSIESTEIDRAARGVVVQNEAQLVKRFCRYLESQGRQVRRCKITTRGSVTLYTDLADVTE